MLSRVLALVISSTLTMGWASLGSHTAAELEIDLGEQQAIEYALQQRVDGLLSAKNDERRTYRRGAFSHDYRRVDTNTYLVGFVEDTAGETSLKTERYDLTLTRQAGHNSWAITGGKLVDTFEGLIRSTPGDETFHRFDRFALDLEGLKLTVSGGSLFLDYLGGEVSEIVMTGSIDWSYAPPAHAPQAMHATYAYLEDVEADDLVFDAERVSLTCSAKRCQDVLGTIDGLKEASLETVDSTLRDAYKGVLADRRNDRAKDPFSGFAPVEEPDRSRLRVAVKRASPTDHYLWLDNDSFDGWDVHVGVSGSGNVLGHYSKDLTAGTTPDELDRRPDGIEWFYEVVGVEGTVELALEDSQTMAGDVTVTLLAKRDLDRVGFALSREREGGGANSQARDPSLVINAIHDGKGRELTWAKVDSSSVVIAMREPVKAGETVPLRIRWINEGAIEKIFPSYSRLPRSGWLPFVRFGDLVDEFDLTVKIPAKYTALSVGKKVSDEIQGDVNVTRWTSGSPVNFPTVIFGDYLDAEPTFQAKTADGTVIPVTVHGDVDGMRAWGIRPKQLVPLAEAAANSINLYREVFGVDYPFAKLDLVSDPGRSFAAQSPASIVYVGGAVFRGSGAVADGSLSRFNNSVIPHEVGHQWWGSLVAHSNQRNYWFVESLAEFASALFIEALYGRVNPEKGLNSYREHVDEWRHEIIESGMWGSVYGTYDINVGGGNASIYKKGPYAFHMLRTTFGNEKTDGFLRNLATQLQGREITTYDIQRVAEKSFGGNMSWFFDQWIRGVGIPQYTFEYTVRRAEDNSYLVQGTVSQKVVMGKEDFVAPDLYYKAVGYVTVTGAKSHVETTIGPFLIEGPETKSIIFKFAEEPLQVEFNKYGEILAKDVIVKK